MPRARRKQPIKTLSAGKELIIGVRAKPNFVKALDEWRKLQPRRISRPEALRQLAARHLIETWERS